MPTKTEIAEHNAVEAAEAFDAEHRRLIELALQAAEQNLNIALIRKRIRAIQQHWACDENTSLN